jgi:hypothetical protein
VTTQVPARARPDPKHGALHRRNSATNQPFTSMVAITISAAAFEAIRATLPHGAPRSIGPDGQMRIWLDHDLVDALRALRRQGESYSDVILRLAKTAS